MSFSEVWALWSMRRAPFFIFLILFPQKSVAGRIPTAVKITPALNSCLSVLMLKASFSLLTSLIHIFPKNWIPFSWIFFCTASWTMAGQFATGASRISNNKISFPRVCKASAISSPIFPAPIMAAFWGFFFSRKAKISLRSSRSWTL